jgi:hypothetical protein
MRETLIARQAKPGNTPTGDVAKAKRAASLNDALKRRATGVSSSQDAAHAGSRNV